MSTKLTISGTKGKIIADRQEVQIYMREARSDLGLNQGWNVRYTTELTEPVDYYLRGEEYSAQIEHFAKHIEANDLNTRSTFATAVEADMTVDAIRYAASRPGIGIDDNDAVAARPSPKTRTGLARIFGKS